MLKRKKIITVSAILIAGFVGFQIFGQSEEGPKSPLIAAPTKAEAPRDYIKFPPVNKFIADGVNPIPHGEPAQQDSTPIAGPLDESRALQEDEILYQHLGPGHFGAFTSSLYPDGRRVLWSSGVNGVFKLDDETYEILAHIPSDYAVEYTQEWAEEITAKLDKNNGQTALWQSIKAIMPLRDLSAVYTVVGSNGWFYIANKDGTIRAYGDAVDGDASSEIVEKAVFKMPAEAAGPSVGMNVTFDGWIILPTEMGYLVAVSQDLSDYRIIRLKHQPDEDMESQGVGYGWVRNSLAIDEEGGVYVASRNHMHKVVWKNQTFSTDEKDGAWVAAYRNGTGAGTGATPSLMGFEDEDRFVVITDGDERMNVTLFWRDEIPQDWQQLPHAPSRRIAAMAPVTMGQLNVAKIQSEQTVVVSGYGALVVNNRPRNIPFYMPENGFSHGFLIGPLGSNPRFQPFGVQKFHWDPSDRKLYTSWVNEDVSSPNGVPWVSAGTNQVYFIGARNNQWTLEALDWYSGDETFHYVIGGQKYNSEYSGVTLDENGQVFYGTIWGRAKLLPKND